jgi:hypothetical protein
MNTSRLITTLILCALLLLTNRWLTYQEGIDVLKAADTQSYMTIAKAAPGLPTPLANEADRLPTNHTARFVVPYLAGTITHFTGISHERMFLVCTLFFCALVVVVVHHILRHTGVNNAQYSVLMLLLIGNPYMFRYYVAVPAMVNDMVFVAGLSIMLLGLLRVRFWFVVGGALVAIIGRQNALVVLPAVGAWMMLGEGWKDSAIVARLTRFVFVVVGVVAVYVALGMIIAPFSVRGMESDALTGLVRWIVAPTSVVNGATNGIGIDSSGKVKIFAEYLLRTLICLLFPLMIMFAVALDRRLRGTPLTRFAAWLPREFWLAMLFVAALYGFAFLGGPELFMSGVTRYVSHALPAMILALAVVLKRYGVFAQQNGESDSSMIVCLGAVIASASFHHITTFGGTSSDKALYFAVMYCCLAIFAGVCTLYMLRQKS